MHAGRVLGNKVAPAAVYEHSDCFVREGFLGSRRLGEVIIKTRRTL